MCWINLGNGKNHNLTLSYQITFLGYVVIRGNHHEVSFGAARADLNKTCRTILSHLLSFQPIFLVPLPFITVWVMRYFRRHYAEPSNRLSLERAIQRDLLSDLKTSIRQRTRNYAGLAMEDTRIKFDKNHYKQPILTEKAMEPIVYRRDREDPTTKGKQRVVSRLRSSDPNQLPRHL